MKAIAIAIALVASTAAAQPAPTPAQQPAPAPAPDSKPDTKSHEKAGTNESLQNGADAARPWAQGVSQQDQQTALQLFHDGNVHLNDGLFAKAVEKYQLALSHWDHPAIHYNLALALMNLDRTIEAYDNFESALKFGEAPLQSKDKFDSARNYLVVLSHAIGELWVTCNKPGAKISVDGKPVFTAPGTYKSKVKVGRHTIVAELEGHPTRVDAPDIQPGPPFKFELKLYTNAELTRYKHRWERAQWVPYAVIGLGALVGVGGGVLEYHASNKYKDYDVAVEKCGTTCQNTQSLKDIRSSGDTYKSAGFALYGAGAAVAVTGAILAIVNRRTSYQIRSEDVQDLEPRVQIQPVVSPSFAGAALSGRF